MIHSTILIFRPPTTRRDGDAGGSAGTGPVVVKKDHWKMAADKLQQEEPVLTELIGAVQQAAQAIGSDDFATQLFNTTEQPLSSQTHHDESSYEPRQLGRADTLGLDGA